MLSILSRLALVATLLVAGNAGFARDGNGREANSADSGAGKILVTFKDERIQRPPVGDPVNAYRLRGNYDNSTWSRRIAEELAEEYGITSVIQWPIDSLGIHCVVYRVPGDQPMEPLIRLLTRDERVESVQAMNQFHVMAEGYSDPYFNLQRDIQNMRIESAHRVSTGRNVQVAVIDTGVDAKHPDIEGQIALTENFVGEKDQTGDDIHGTAVAGIIAASANNKQGIVGIAPDARLIVLKACWQLAPQKPEASCDSLTLALALNAAIKLKPGVINLSLTGPEDPLLLRLVDKALELGIVVIASDSQKIGENFPAHVKGVIPVASAEIPASAPSIQPLITAPGREILTTLPHASYNFMSGSSFAAAHVSGIAALLLELNPRLKGEQIVEILQASIHGPADAKLAGALNACEAVARVSHRQACSDLELVVSK